MSPSPSERPALYAAVRHLPRPPGPCEVPGCAEARERRLARLGVRARADYPAPRHVREHCHAHGYVRGITCEVHNVLMSFVDARVLMPLDWCRRYLPALLGHRARCPGCAAGPPWSPVLTLGEYEQRHDRRRLLDLARLEGAARAAALELLALAEQRRVIRARYQSLTRVYPTAGQLAQLAAPWEVDYA